MYRIELSPGEETAFRSIEELAVAIRRGVVTTRARIWHNASGKWLPIQFHPHYKIAASMQLTSADLVAGAPVKPLELLSLGELMDPPPPPALPVMEKPEPPVRLMRTPEPKPKIEHKPEPKPEPKPRKKVAAKSRTVRARRRPMHIALAGALLIACAHLVFSAALAAPSEDTAMKPRTHRRLVTTPTNTIVQGRPETTAANVLPGLPAVPRSAPRPSTAPRPSLKSQSEAATPPLGAFQADSEAAIQPAPVSVDIAAPAPLSGDALAKSVVDSTGKKTLKRILRTIGGSSSQEPIRSKR
jgi:hypothetical protein